jgi:hypothetical protein
MTLIAAATMLGSLLGGTVGEIWGLAPALALGALVQIAAGFLTLYSPVPKIVDLQEPESMPMLASDEHVLEAATA